MYKGNLHPLLCYSVIQSHTVSLAEWITYGVCRGSIWLVWNNLRCLKCKYGTRCCAETTEALNILWSFSFNKIKVITWRASCYFIKKYIFNLITIPHFKFCNTALLFKLRLTKNICCLISFFSTVPTNREGQRSSPLDNPVSQPDNLFYSPLNIIFIEGRWILNEVIVLASFSVLVMESFFLESIFHSCLCLVRRWRSPFISSVPEYLICAEMGTWTLIHAFISKILNNLFRIICNLTVWRKKSSLMEILTTFLEALTCKYTAELFWDFCLAFSLKFFQMWG